jgi:ribose 5-phosphate isomerase A
MGTQDELKRQAAFRAVEFVESGMVVGLGTGSTTEHAVKRIAARLTSGTRRQTNCSKANFR